MTVRVRGFGELEAAVMDRLWGRDRPTTVRELFEDFSQGREIAYTTVMSTMDNLHRKGWQDRKRDGKAFVYWPVLTREQHTAKLMREAFDGGGRSEVVLTHFVEQMSEDEAAGLRAALERLVGNGDA